MPTVTDLNIKNPSFDQEKSDDLWALYSGGEAFEARKSRFIEIAADESYNRYQKRLGHVEYRNYTGSIINYFAMMLFTSKPVALAFKDSASGDQILEPDQYWTDLREDCDRTGMDIDAFFKATVVEAMVLGKSWIAILQPDNAGETAMSRFDFEQRKLGDCWLRHLEYDCVLDWELDDLGNLDWVLTHDKTISRKSIAGKRNWVTETWTHYQKDKIDYYRLEYDIDTPPDRKQQVPLIYSQEHGAGVCPIVCMQLDESYQIAATLKSPQLSNLKNVSNQNWSIACSCFAQPVAKVSDPQAFGNSRVGAGFGIVIGVDEDWTWEAPPAAHFAACDVQINSTKEEIHRLAYQMALGVSDSSTSVGRTAESKSQDAQSTRVALTSYGRVVKQTIERVYDIISDIRGDSIDWDITGFDDFAATDTIGLLTMAMDLSTAGGVPSPTFNSQFKQKIAESVMPDLDESIKSTIRDEIETSVMTAPSQQDQELQLFAAQHAIVAGDVSAGGLLAPQTKPNATKNQGGTKKFAGPKPTKPSSGGKGGSGGFVKAKKPGGK